jgi:hypothetical protein
MQRPLNGTLPVGSGALTEKAGERQTRPNDATGLAAERDRAGDGTTGIARLGFRRLTHLRGEAGGGEVAARRHDAVSRAGSDAAKAGARRTGQASRGQLTAGERAGGAGRASRHRLAVLRAVRAEPWSTHEHATRRWAAVELGDVLSCRARHTLVAVGLSVAAADRSVIGRAPGRACHT